MPHSYETTKSFWSNARRTGSGTEIIGIWSAHVDQGEDLSKALVRECEEEVGLTPSNYALVDTIYEEGDVEKKTPFFHLFGEPLGGDKSPTPRQ